MSEVKDSLPKLTFFGGTVRVGAAAIEERVKIKEQELIEGKSEKMYFYD